MMHQLAHYFDVALHYLTLLVYKIGYFGIFFGMFLESTFVPVPSEIIMVPAGILVASGKMNMYIVIIAGTLGSLAGALFNYFLALLVGRSILFKIGKYFLLPPKTIIKIEEYFKKHGPISTFIGRLIPGVRHYISLPAGIARMNLVKFSFYTTLGAFIWCTILTYLGFAVGKNQELIKKYLTIVIIGCLVFCVALVLIYKKIQKRKNNIQYLSFRK